MHFYTYDEWISNDYYSQDSSQLYKGNTAIFDLSDPSNTSKRYLTVRSCWNDPKFKSTVVGSPVINPKMPDIDLDIGCLYKLSGNVDSNRSLRGCIQQISGDMYKEVYDPPYIALTEGGYYYDYYSGLHKEVMSIDLSKYSSFDRILVFQSIYSGAISFYEAMSSLEFYFSKYYPRYSQYDYQTYNYKISTDVHCNDSLMVAGAMISFDHVGDRKYILIESICEPVYGQVDMDSKYDWNMLWDTYKPSTQIKEDSIMHFAKV